ncbi:MAG: DUF1287 domain-containing protein [Actinobacteria bacterium]|nr:DUF1287 domain-containing protein [Actinomycetota bacterium]
MEKVKKIHIRKSQGFKILILVIILLSALQLWMLYSNYKDVIIKIPQDLFVSPKPLPITELTVNAPYRPPESKEASGEAIASEPEEESLTTEMPDLENTVETLEAVVEETELATEDTSAEYVLSDTQKNIVLRLMELLEEDIEYGYQVYPETGYPSDNVWISTDVISVVLRDAGYDLMELIYKDMEEHKEDYPLDIKNRKEPIKYIDFRDVFFQEKFFKRNALELEIDYSLENKDIQWQPGDIVYFQFDPDNPYQDLGGFISSRTNDQGVPLVIMISKEFGKVSEVDKLLEYTIVGHFRYPNPYEEPE